MTAIASPPIPLPDLPILTVGGADSPTGSDSSPPSQSTEALKDIAFGSIAGSIGKTIEYPFDTVKVRLQSQSLSHPLYAGPIDCFRQSIRADGIIRGLYRGISAPIVGAAIETSSLFFSYRIAQDVLLRTIYKDVGDRKALPMGALLSCGAISGAFTSLLLTPIELVKCQMQVPLETGAVRGPGPLSIIAKVFRHHGILGFWHGQLGTLIRETGGSAAWFGSYEGMSLLFQRYNAQREHHPVSAMAPSHVASQSSPPPLPVYQQLLAGATAGVAYNFVFFPADTIKSRMQTADVTPSTLVLSQASSKQYGLSSATALDTTGPSAGVGSSNVVPRQTFWAAGRALWKQQGLRGMYRGCGITVGRAAPSSAFIFAVYEGLRGWWG